ncbi:hypothetical protein A3C98_03835 [Candidatus Roizmanbacteria bacterium RIFCSPHIGHO2_02_FULL_37_15]|uniref:VTT domain-containing protein n=1 Tax=Candidatus Roizmanbacteria bacterium RIFCSPLOWO2_01_FULL_37_16 TaxID=1802058 RepID=A0A1F7IKN3_9BACT|nr:MAG: hypothetical protein A2859_04900 [Candidatus Roizmanbacteria bacterium RIFCSPHIGHO2_01_FULL_37_16b]OGK22000.1 MAG: hypothetical protein A3C98_03835 [Candidatus Roizmanbacteria bacterium RIFCSPHIGHO2_02_FULL_37_15]OGK31761.1 MAG: hypothetical protein A3F57_00240 [Candidatus Roizmanbacteria bacterium RIFCSPHIGHO2_12_FULL_36_11]OGK43921.1 MAG: hypothetical protein A3B40_03875 [Candidatus Roizmanbacteria bacterium RIFCSPLOWO2_01_FULL_37_16]OGK56350.1 MAG: hypothetical protein A3I50_03450 [C
MSFDLIKILPTIGYFGIFAIVFAESGLLVGFFLPGDSLLFTAGFLASQGVFDIRILAFLCFTGAVLGDSIGYAFGHKVGRRLFHKKDSLLFHRDNLIKAERFYEKHGKKTIVIARFMPMIRTFAPIVAGVGNMEYKSFLAYNIIGGLLWGIGITIAGYFLGNLVPDVDKYLLPIIAAIIIVSIAPTAFHILKDPNHRKQLLAILFKPFKPK